MTLAHDPPTWSSIIRIHNVKVGLILERPLFPVRHLFVFPHFEIDPLHSKHSGEIHPCTTMRSPSCRSPSGFTKALRPFYFPCKIQLSQKVCWYPLHDACQPSINAPCPPRSINNSAQRPKSHPEGIHPKAHSSLLINQSPQLNLPLLEGECIIF